MGWMLPLDFSPQNSGEIWEEEVESTEAEGMEDTKEARSSQ